jgi:hypothetical protein
MKDTEKRKRTTKPERRVSVSLLERIQPDAAGIDCGEKSHFVAVPTGRDPQPGCDQPISSPACFRGTQLARGRLPAHRSAIDSLPDFAIVADDLYANMNKYVRSDKSAPA